MGLVTFQNRENWSNLSIFLYSQNLAVKSHFESHSFCHVISYAHVILSDDAYDLANVVYLVIFYVLATFCSPYKI